VNALTSIIDVKTEFEQTRARIKKQTERIKERAQARALRRSQPEVWADMEREFHHGLTLSDSKEEVELPCENLPWPADPNFCGRVAILDELHKKLDHDEKQPFFRSFALYGIPGIGKTQTALAYAHQRVKSGVKAVLWVQAETMLDIDTSFTKIAVKLGLKGAVESGDHTQNRYLVTKWLQKTRKVPTNLSQG
jgi:DNA replication protein DnaC